MIEETYRQKADEQKMIKAAGQNIASLTSDLFAERHRMSGGAIVSLLLIERTAKRAAESSEILKQQRRALEARGLAAPKAAGKKRLLSPRPRATPGPKRR